MRKSKTKTNESNGAQEAQAIKPSKTYRAFYVGKRVNTKNSLSHFWLPEGQDASYGRKDIGAPARIGECWEFSATDDDRIFLVGSSFPPKCVRTELDPRYKQWAAEEQVSIRRHTEDIVNKKLAKRTTEFEEALKPLRDMLNTLHGADYKSAFIDQVRNALWKQV